jgi:hypothetical protein
MIKYIEDTAINFWRDITPFELLDFKFSPQGQQMRELERINKLSPDKIIQITLEYMNNCQNS